MVKYNMALLESLCIFTQDWNQGVNQIGLLLLVFAGDDAVTTRGLGSLPLADLRVQRL